MFDVIKKSFSEFSEDRCTTLAAALAYYTIFSLPPLLFILVTMVALFIGWFNDTGEAKEDAYKVVQQQISTMIGNQAAEEEIGRIMKSTEQSAGLGWKTALSFVGILVGATGVVASLQDSLNRVWGVKLAPDASGWKDVLMKRFLSLAMILGLGFVLVVSFVLNTILNSITGMVGDQIGFQPQIATIVNFAVSLAVVTLIFAAIFKFMPDVDIQWRDVWIGALVTAVLFTVGRLVLGVYFSYSSPGAELGSAAGSLVVLLVWVYYTAMIVLLGAEFTQVCVQHSGRVLTPEKGAVKFEERMVAAGQ